MLTKYEHKLAMGAIQRKKLFLSLSIASVIIGLFLSALYLWQANTQPSFDVGIHIVLVVMILLNGRQNLRQYNYAKILESVMLNNNSATKHDYD